MRRLVALTMLAMIPSPAAAHPQEQHSGDPAEIRFRTEDGARFSARLGDVSQLTRGCLGRAPQVLSGERIDVEVVVAGRAEGRFSGYRSADRVLLQSSGGDLIPRGRWCRAAPEALEAFVRARRLPGSRGPWLAFVAMFGGLALAVTLVALWGHGVGPEPSLSETPPEEESAH